MPAQYDVRITNEALAGLQGIFDYVRQSSPQNAALVVERLLAAIEGLDILPYRFKVFRRNKNLDLVIRSMPVRPFIVYYRIMESPRTVRILSVRHGAQRPPRSF